MTNARRHGSQSAPPKLWMLVLAARSQDTKVRGSSAALAWTMVLGFAPRPHPKDGFSEFQRMEGHYVLPRDLDKARAPGRERAEASATPRPAGSRLWRLASKLWRSNGGVKP